MRRNNRSKQRGNTLIEFALLSVFLVPLLIGTVNVGMRLSHSIQATQVSRDAGHMFVRQVDFSIDANKDIIVRLAGGMGMTRTGGDGVVILTLVTFVGDSECTGAGLSIPQCTNHNYPVITKRLIIGNAALRSSDFGTPSSSIVNSDGSVDPMDYLTDSSARTSTNFGNLLTLQASELAYISEAYFATPTWDFPTTWSNTGIYARTIF
jgi:hypothetical protein